jgi:phage baseplate assembly protein W|tara:strand:- start:2237 stop:2686 length:450 start_codon:yes stop_codon:yes gene_type:complete
MATYVGFSTVNADKPRTVNPPPAIDNQANGITNPIVFGKKFKLVDEQLVIQDLVNALNIRKGEKVGQPSYGTTLWDFVFEPNTADVQVEIQNEVRRVASLDPRIDINTIRAFPKENGILIEVQLSINPYNNAGDLALFFNSQTNTAALA